jgi:hypothetical protein
MRLAKLCGENRVRSGIHCLNECRFRRLIVAPGDGNEWGHPAFINAGRGAVGQVELAEEFRTRAQRCLKLAQEAPTLEAQTHWLAMAQLWFSLAQHAEEQDALFLSNSALRLGANGNGDENGHANGNDEGEGEGSQ